MVDRQQGVSQVLRLQETRTKIVRELETGLNDPSITLNQLQQVIQISTQGLLEIKTEIDEIVEKTLQTEAQTAGKRLQSLEEQRLSEQIRIHQLRRLGRQEHSEEIQTLQKKLQESLERINEAIQELRYSAE